MKGLFQLIIVILIFAHCDTNLRAQGFYINFETLYRTPVIKTDLGPRRTNAGLPNESISNVRGSFGKGLGMKAEFGYMLNAFLGLGLNVEYIAGIKTLAEEISSGPSLDQAVVGVRRLYLTPLITIEGQVNKFQPFAKLGIIIPAAGHVNGIRTSNDPALLDPLITLLFPDATGFEASSRANGQFSAGFQGTLGVKYMLNDQIAVFGSVGITAATQPRRRLVVTEALLQLNDGTTVDVSSLLALAGQYAYTEYVEEIDLQVQQDQMDEGAEAFALNPPFDLENPSSLIEEIVSGFPALHTYYGTEDFPHQQLEIDSNFNTLNFGLGISIAFGNKHGSR